MGDLFVVLGGKLGVLLLETDLFFMFFLGFLVFFVYFSMGFLRPSGAFCYFSRGLEDFCSGDVWYFWRVLSRNYVGFLSFIGRLANPSFHCTKLGMLKGDVAYSYLLKVFLFVVRYSGQLASSSTHAQKRLEKKSKVLAAEVDSICWRWICWAPPWIAFFKSPADTLAPQLSCFAWGAGGGLEVSRNVGKTAFQKKNMI